MGREAACALEWQGRRVDGKALLETEELLFRGSDATRTRLKIRRDAVTSIEVADGILRVGFGGDSAGFVLGAAAEKWAAALVAKKSRLDKLGAFAGQKISVVGVDDALFREELRERVGVFSDGSFATKSDLVFLGVHAPLELSQVARAKQALAPTGGLWIVRQKGKGPVPEGEVRAAAHGAGLVDVKVCAFSATHTADKFVIPVAARERAK